jgi:hypothetical protein
VCRRKIAAGHRIGHTPEIVKVSLLSENGRKFNRCFELFVRYVRRLRGDGERTYDGGFQDPVFVAFDLFTLTGDHVTYDKSSRTLLATGDVTTTNGTRARTHANSMKLRIADDRALRLP